jgi:alkanesulfonate monooxygenase SsuD/methylene tetrahydromethanopterin reductase-like flavin-dependent oxidoreductase (luciferase family)
MDVGIGLPNAVPDTAGGTLVEWARRAEEAGFSTLGTIGRLVYPNYEELIALAAAAAVLLAPLRTNTALCAKQAASLDRVSGGRLVLGLGIGGREDDFAASGVTMAGRGRRFDEQLAELQRVWAGAGRGGIDPIGPPPARPGGPELILGGTAEASFRRVARVAAGWINGGGSPDMFAQAAAAVDQAWRDEGRPGQPRKLSLAYFALGPDARALADGYLGSYYAFLGDIAGQIAASAAVSPEMVRGYAAAFAEAGCDELIFVPASSSLEQVSLLAEAVS